MRFDPSSRVCLAANDLLDTARNPRIWLLLAWNDVRQRYRRSLLGPFWLTLSTGVMVGALGLVYAAIFKVDVAKYVPYLATGLVMWGFLATLANEGCQSFIAGEGIIKQLRLPLSLHVARVLWRNVIILGHNLIIVLVVLLWFGSYPGLSGLLLFILGLSVVLINATWLCLLLGLVCARFRDVPLIVSNLVQLFFFLTPILWDRSLMPGRQRVIDWNPAFHFVEVVRAPLLGDMPSTTTWLFIGITTVMGWTILFALFVRYRRRIAYWL